MQQFLQRLLEEEVDGVLGRARYARRDPVDAGPGYRNGFGKPRRLSLSNGTITLRRPRVRGLEARFESRLLPAFKRRTGEGGRLLPGLYLHGLAHGDFDLALRGLLGDGAPLSAPSIARLKAGWQAEHDLWKSRSVEDLEVVYLWVDGVYVKAGLEKDKAANARAASARTDFAALASVRIRIRLKSWPKRASMKVRLAESKVAPMSPRRRVCRDASSSTGSLAWAR